MTTHTASSQNARLCPTCGKDLNDGPCDCPDTDPTTDERLASLKNLKL